MNWQGDGFWKGQKQYLVYFWFHLQSGSSGASSSWGIQPPLLEFLPPLLLLPHIFLRLSLGLYFLHILHQNLLLCCSFLISIRILFLQLHLPPFPSSPPPPLSPPPPALIHDDGFTGAARGEKRRKNASAPDATE